MPARLLLVAALFASTLAWATGERIVVSPAASPLREALCVSMTCGARAAAEVFVTTRVSAGTLEVVVARGSAAPRVVAVAPLAAGGSVSSTDLARLVTRAVAAIEGRGTQESAAKVAAAPKPVKKAKLPAVLVARRGMP